MFDRRLLKNFDYLTLMMALLICALGIIVIASATRTLPLQDQLLYVRKQTVWVGLGLAGIAVIISINYDNFLRWSWYIYGLNVLLLLAVLFIGKETGGAYRWLDLGFFDLQPSELAKIAVIISLARILSERADRLENIFDLAPVFLNLAIPMLLIFAQPDLGTSLVIVFIFLVMFYVAGVPIKIMIGLLLSGLALFPFMYTRLLDYQKMRLISFLNHDIDPLGYGYQLAQSVIAIGSGGLKGKGLFQGTQARLQFIPEQHTDFIFSVLGEEFGFVGGVLLILAYAVLIYRILKIGSLSKDTFGALICVGVAAMLFFQVLVNIGMTISVMPVTGLPLPFMSYGGNSMLVNLLSIGLVLNIGMRRHKIQF